MANIRLPEDEKRVKVSLAIKKKYRDELKEKKVNMSQLFEEKIVEFLKKK
jgi:hypothetical protein